MHAQPARGASSSLPLDHDANLKTSLDVFFSLDDIPGPAPAVETGRQRALVESVIEVVEEARRTDASTLRRRARLNALLAATLVIAAVAAATGLWLLATDM